MIFFSAMQVFLRVERENDDDDDDDDDDDLFVSICLFISTTRCLYHRA